MTKWCQKQAVSELEVDIGVNAMVDLITTECAMYNRVPRLKPGRNLTDWQLRDMYINLFRQNPPDVRPEDGVRIIVCHRLGDIVPRDFHRNVAWETVRHVRDELVPHTRDLILDYAVRSAIWIDVNGTVPPAHNVPDKASIMIGIQLVKLANPYREAEMDLLLKQVRPDSFPRGIHHWAVTEALITLKEGGKIDEHSQQSVLRALVA